MQHARGYRSLLKALFPIVMIAGIFAHAPLKADPLKTEKYTQRMQLSANGQMLSLLLRPSRVTSDLSVVDHNGALQGVPVRTYIGKIEGDNSSWVRLTQGTDSLEGVISRHGKRFRLQQTGNQPAVIKPLADNNDHRITLTKNRNTLTRSIAVNSRKSQSVTRVAKIAIAVDSKFNAHHNGRGLEYALAIINSVDGIYREEFGLALQVESAINVVDAQADPFNYGNVAIETMLRSFRRFRLQSTLIDQDVSLVHLFTGNKPADEPVGLAWIDTACRTDGYDVGISTHYRHDILLAAHEIAHNLGALHDSDTACAASTDKVMWPYISSGTSQHFSSCTVETVKRTLAQSCHAQAIDLELALSVDNGNTLKATVRNTDPRRDNPAATLAIDLPEGGRATTLKGDCTTNANLSEIDRHIECKVGALAPGNDSVIIFEVDTALSHELVASVEPDQYVDVHKNNNSGRVASENQELQVVPQLQSFVPTVSFRANDGFSRSNTTGSGSFSFTMLFLIMGLVVVTRSIRVS